MMVKVFEMFLDFRSENSLLLANAFEGDDDSETDI